MTAELKTRFRDNVFQAESFRTEHASELHLGTVDLLLLASSWQERCVAISDSGPIQAAKVILLTRQPQSKPDDESQTRLQNHTERLCQFAGQQLVQICVDPNDIETSWDKLQAIAYDARCRKWVRAI